MVGEPARPERERSRRRISIGKRPLGRRLAAAAAGEDLAEEYHRHGGLIGQGDDVAFAKEIREAKVAGAMVRIERDAFETGWLTGFIVATGPKYFAMELVTGSARLDGIACMRYTDVTKFGPEERAGFMTKALAARGEVRATQLPVSIATLPKLLESAGKAFPIITIHVPDDEMDGYACYIGRVVKLNAESVDFHHITPDGAWEKALSEIPFSHIVRVDFGNDYEDALFLVAGRPRQIRSRT